MVQDSIKTALQCGSSERSQIQANGHQNPVAASLLKPRTDTVYATKNPTSSYRMATNSKMSTVKSIKMKSGKKTDVEHAEARPQKAAMSPRLVKVTKN
uniref:Uncharacterized protein n=1 Tax=Bifidobacterium asteroides TaxID=1684 RepID=A0ABS3ITV3_9BIFI